MKKEKSLEEMDDPGENEVEYHLEDEETVTAGRDEDEDREINVECFREEWIDDELEEDEDECLSDGGDDYRGRDQRRRRRREERARKRAPHWDAHDPFEDEDWSWKP